MAIDLAVLRMLAAAGITATPVENGQLLSLKHRDSGITLERPVFPDPLNVQHAIDALTVEVQKTQWAGRDSNPEPAT